MHNQNSLDTIAAIATSLGESGIGIVRVSGQDALKICDEIFFSKQGRKPSGFKTYTMHYGWIVDETAKIIDEVILTIMRSPHSYTKEDVAEINCHGGIVAQRAILDLVLAKGARLAEPGEFTKRAFLSGRIDLAQAEAVLDIIQAKTDLALSKSLEQLKGGFSKEIRGTRESLLEPLTYIEANIDFPDDEAERKDLAKAGIQLRNAHIQLKEILSSTKRGRFFREGLHVVICGKPNVGKSSLLNALLKTERSIVTPIAGTTRDAIEEIIDIRGIPVRIVDTAGIIAPRNIVEKKAIGRSKKHIEQADLVLLIFDAGKKLEKSDLLLIKTLKNKPVIAIINKLDLKQKIEKDKIRKIFPRVVEISAKKLKNMNLLEDAIAGMVNAGNIVFHEPSSVSNTRHLEKLKKAEKLVAEALNSLDNNLSLEFVAQDIKQALGQMDELLGESFSEDLLDKIFSRFCIGK